MDALEVIAGHVENQSFHDAAKGRGWLSFVDHLWSLLHPKDKPKEQTPEDEPYEDPGTIKEPQ